MPQTAKDILQHLQKEKEFKELSARVKEANLKHNTEIVIKVYEDLFQHITWAGKGFEIERINAHNPDSMHNTYCIVHRDWENLILMSGDGYLRPKKACNDFVKPDILFYMVDIEEMPEPIMIDNKLQYDAIMDHVAKFKTSPYMGLKEHENAINAAESK